MSRSSKAKSEKVHEQVPGEWGGSGAAVTFSTRATRQADRGWFEVQRCVMALAATHLQHMTVYGAGNDRRLTASPRRSVTLGVHITFLHITCLHITCLHASCLSAQPQSEFFPS